MELELKDKVAVITGGSKGIGLAIAEGLAKEGAQLALCARDEQSLMKASEQIQSNFNAKTIGIKTDVTSADEINHLLTEIEKEYSGIDILVNNAGTGSEEKIMTAPDDRWQYYWDLHVMAAVRISRGLVPLMRKKGGGIILNNASIAAKQPVDFEPIYNVTKAALSMFSKCLANELIGENIRVNCINLGYILTPDWVNTATSLGKAEGISWEVYLDRIAKANAPIGRFASTEEIANFFVFLCSSRASYCVGSSYYVDGGLVKTVI